MKHVLDFERPLLELEQKLEEMRALSAQLDIAEEIRELEQKLEELRQQVYSSLTRWQRVQIARHPERPYTLDYVRHVFTDFVELHGDRCYGDDPAIVGGLARFEGIPVVVVGHQKGRDTKENLRRNFGMPNPEGYRKALRLFRLAEKFRKPVITFLDTPGAYPGIGAEERGQAEAIARNLFEMARLQTPIVVVIIGEGGSGGALGIGVGDRILMLQYAWYSVIAPESCSSILWRSWDFKEQAAEELELCAEDLLRLGVIDRIVPEPLGGAHRNPQQMYQILREVLRQELLPLLERPVEELVRQRQEKFFRMGVWQELPA
ncbi:MAG: acetyl-CoA carboxylase carboxyltransferase subunit alpha [Chlorobiota bacterium]|nr:acetyl-CoA carboxylase carboxyltransferase subunit alpha [Chlorobiota bacterium]